MLHFSVINSHCPVQLLAGPWLEMNAAHLVGWYAGDAQSSASIAVHVLHSCCVAPLPMLTTPGNAAGSTGGLRRVSDKQ